MKRVLLTLFFFIPAIVFAAAGFADRYEDHQRWIFPAYAYCLAFGVAIMLILTTLSLIYKSKINKAMEATSAYLIEHPVAGIIVAGILWAIILGITVSVSWEIIWFLTILPYLFFVFAFPLNLANKKMREKNLLSPHVLRWTGIISLSAIFASVLFIIFTNHGILRGTDITYFSWRGRYNNPQTHPYDSMREIWSMPFLFMAEIVVAVIFFGLGKIKKYLCRKLSIVSQKRRQIDSDTYSQD